MRNKIYSGLIFFYIGLILIIVNILTFKTTKSILDKQDSISYNTLVSSSDKIVDIKLSFIGDSELASFKGQKSYMNFQDLLDNKDYSFPYKNVSSIFREDDFTIANGENVFTDRNLSPMEKNHSPAYWYYAKTRFANIYKESSIEVVSVMNNHAYDYGITGYHDTINALKNVGVIPAAEDDVILEKDGIKIGLIAINLFHSFQADQAVSRIKNIREKVNYIIVYFHGGTEFVYNPPGNIVEYSHKFIDNGADLVVGCHPHVLQPVEIYKDKKIVYSLGSFLFGGARTILNRTIIYQLKIRFNLTSNEIIERQDIIPCHLYSQDTGYEKWIPDVIHDENEKQLVIDFMNGLRNLPY